MCIIKKNIAHPKFSNIFKPIILANQQVWRNRKRNWFLSSLACNICHRLSSFAFPDSFPRDCLPESWESLGIFEIVADFDSLLSIYDRDTVDPWKSWTVWRDNLRMLADLTPLRPIRSRFVDGDSFSFHRFIPIPCHDTLAYIQHA